MACSRYHLGLIIPDDYTHCGIRVGSATYNWQKGKSIVFDDSFEHEVWIEVDVELMSVAPIALTGGIKVELREFVKSPRLVPMDHLDQPIPIDL